MAPIWDFYEALNDLFGAGHRRGFEGIREPTPDIEAEFEVTLGEAYTGGRCRIFVDTPMGTRGYDITIPPGVTDGQRLRLAGCGLPGPRRPATDLYLVVRLAPDARYRVDGRDVTVGLPVAPWEAALGATAWVDAPDGRVRIEVPARSSSGHRIRLPGHGLPNPRGAPGDLYAEIEVVVPQHLTTAERDLFAQLSRRSRFDPRALPDND
ncbi:hypothetical protein HC028_15715 [Planosporangium flavigriseum]|uniref:Chaperone DnaJ C-terminal domain-containing protein n=1 Tax=Planosporangium flavigriseum TaxID=373681 RepID=A0A8J3LS67_9ACTN|nr:DnaJ C-terminal domain-containing protein [Planosporangium flavigriseum]NJC65938.1 hypothetical protein [Planosporangium flavigriseum]GIG75643.1 hypothetical protein Pfl04_40470 [Planosporangium flavigriseum]